MALRLDYRLAFRRLEKAYFRSRLSRLFAELMSRKARHLYQIAIDAVGPLPDGSRIADIGCGHGTFLAMYLSQHPTAVGFGLDQSAELIRFAKMQCEREKANAEFLVGDVHEAPLPEKAFDAMVSTSSIYCWHDPVLALNRLYDSLKTGARFLLWDVLPVTNFKEARIALFDQKVFGLSVPAYTEGELLEFVRASRFGDAAVEKDKLIIRFELFRSEDE